jgi:hypothetical protein
MAMTNHIAHQRGVEGLFPPHGTTAVVWTPTLPISNAARYLVARRIVARDCGPADHSTVSIVVPVRCRSRPEATIRIIVPHQHHAANFCRARVAAAVAGAFGD